MDLHLHYLLQQQVINDAFFSSLYTGRTKEHCLNLVQARQSLDCSCREGAKANYDQGTRGIEGASCSPVMDKALQKTLPKAFVDVLRRNFVFEQVTIAADQQKLPQVRLREDPKRVPDLTEQGRNSVVSGKELVSQHLLVTIRSLPVACSSNQQNVGCCRSRPEN